MENASKAIIMAGGVLIAVAIISLALYAYSSFSGYAKSSEQILTATQIQNFNRFYESFGNSTNTLDINKYKIRGIDVLNIYNKAKEDKKNDDALNIDDNGIVNAISGDSSTFFPDNYTVTYKYDSHGKINKIELNKLKNNL